MAQEERGCILLLREQPREVDVVCLTIVLDRDLKVWHAVDALLVLVPTSLVSLSSGSLCLILSLCLGTCQSYACHSEIALASQSRLTPKRPSFWLFSQVEIGRGRFRSALRPSISSLGMEKVNGVRPSTLCGA